MEIVYVDSATGLSAAVSLMAKENTYLAIDTEFRREDTYFPQLCLIQVATAEVVFLIDVLSLDDLTPFFDILTNKKLLKVLHSGRQDLEVFCHLMQGEVATPVFDTQIAAMFAGYGGSAGFEMLASKLLGVSLDKSLRHTDWTLRPLTEWQKTYAINDVLYLRPLYEVMVKKLTTKKRLEWMKSEVRLLETASFLITLPSEAWRRLRLPNVFSYSFPLVQKLTEWREDTAQKTNVPRAWLLKDEVILSIASVKPQTVEGLEKIPQFPSNNSWVAQEVLEVIQGVMGAPAETLSQREDLPTLYRSQKGLLEMLKLLLGVLADQLEMHPKCIAEKEDLVRWIADASSASQLHFMTGWRYDVFGKYAEALLEGDVALRISKGRIIVEPTKGKT